MACPAAAGINGVNNARKSPEEASGMGPWSLLNGVGLAWGDFSHESSDPLGPRQIKVTQMQKEIYFLALE